MALAWLELLPHSGACSSPRQCRLFLTSEKSLLFSLPSFMPLPESTHMGAQLEPDFCYPGFLGNRNAIWSRKLQGDAPGG
jgi:hypothetical protein